MKIAVDTCARVCHSWQHRAFKEGSSLETTALVAREREYKMSTAKADNTGTDLEIVAFDKKAPAQFGNDFLANLVMVAAIDEELQEKAAKVADAKSNLGFEMTRAVFELASAAKNKIDVYAVFGKAGDVAKLNTRLLVAMGVQKRTMTEDDEVVYNWTDKKVESLYAYTAALKQENPAEYEKRFRNRKRLNQRLAEACKATATLMDSGNKPGDLVYQKNDTGEFVPVIKNAPKEIAGESDNVALGGRTTLPGASKSPTMGSLVKISTEKHKANKEPTKGKDGESGNTAKLGMKDEDFGAICNQLIRAIKAQEGKLTEDMRKQLANVSKVTAEALKSATK